ncbi:MAG TPA: alpha/beta fold hydrolase [Pyrinomonadaceae bacterium]|nr:alpha/beta fold hydrolase [Pyrinomonadaceae bacterium]
MTNISNKLNFKMVISKMVMVGLFVLIGAAISAFSQTTDIFPIPDTYKTEGILAIKNSEVENLFYDPSAIRSNLIWSADVKNKRLLVTDETNNVYLLNSPLATPVKLFDKIIPYSVKVNPSGLSFAFTSDHEDEDNFQLYVYDFKEKLSKKLINLTGKDESIDSFIWSKTGDALFYTRVDYDTKVSRLCRNNFSEEKCYGQILKGSWDVMDSDQNKVILKYWKASSSQNLYLYDIQTGTLTALDEQGNCRDAFFAQDTVIWTSEGNETCKTGTCIFLFDLKKNAFSQLKLPKTLTNINDAKISPDGKRLLVQDTVAGVDKLHIFRINKNKIEKQIPPFISGSYVIWHTRWLSEKEVVYTLETVEKPASIQSYNVETKQFTNWTKEKLPAQLEGKVKPPEVIKWQSFDKREISGYIVRPQTPKRKTPVLIYVHGGPQVVDKPVFNSQDVRFTANLNLSVIHTNIRGSSDFGTEFMDADNKEKRGDAVQDIRYLLDWIEKQPDLDASQIYVRGISYGGFIVLSTALQEPTRIKGVIAEYPLISIRSYLTQSWIDEFAKNEYGDPSDENLMKKLDELSPVNNTERWNNIPLFLTRGKLDERIPEKEVIDLKNQLQKKGSEVWFIYGTESGHGFGGKYVTAAMYKFLEKIINKETLK